jgi:hypothetical protein
MERSCKWSGKVNVDLLGKFELERNNTMEQIVENVHVSKLKEKLYYYS